MKYIFLLCDYFKYPLLIMLLKNDIYHFFELSKGHGGAVEEFRGQPAFLITAVSDGSA